MYLYIYIYIYMYISVIHALKCKKGGLVDNRHNKIRDEIAYIATLAVNSSIVREEPKINIIHDTRKSGLPVQARAQQEIPPSAPVLIHEDGQYFDRGDVLNYGLWDKQTLCIIDVRVIDTNQVSYFSAPRLRSL